MGQVSFSEVVKSYLSNVGSSIARDTEILIDCSEFELDKAKTVDNNVFLFHKETGAWLYFELFDYSYDYEDFVHIYLVLPGQEGKYDNFLCDDEDGAYDYYDYYCKMGTTPETDTPVKFVLNYGWRSN